MELYPFKFEPIFIPKVWGGRRIQQWGRTLPGDDSTPIGESWEIADLQQARSVIRNGPLAGPTLHSVMAQAGDDLLGGVRPTEDGGFPLLVKYLDARQNLSVQVHPDKRYLAETQPDAEVRLKSEAWYVLQADPGAVIYKGVREGVTPDSFARNIESGKVVDDLIAVPVKAGQCHFLPSGTCHALGAGIMIAEIQTPSDTTFRVFDWGRTDRQLHIAEALQCIRFGPPDVATNERRSHIAGIFTTVSKICTCEHFIIEKVRMVESYGQEIPYSRPAVWMILEGEGCITKTPAGVDVTFSRGDVLLLPAKMDDARVDLTADTVWLDIQFPDTATDDGILIA